MAIVAMLSAHGSPGVTTTVAALATVWPRPVLVVDADPAGGQLLCGWGHRWWAAGEVSAEQGVVSFAAATRELSNVPAEALAGHAQDVPRLPRVRLVAGVRTPAQAAALGAGWQRLASACRDLSETSDVDVLVDAGRWHPHTPWPLVDAAELVLVGLRPGLRHITTAPPLIEELRNRHPEVSLGLAVLAAPRREAQHTARALKLPATVVVPAAPDEARAFSDGTRHRPRRKQRLAPAMRTAAHHVSTHPACDRDTTGTCASADVEEFHD